MRRAVMLLALVLAAVSLAACGGSGGDADETEAATVQETEQGNSVAAAATKTTDTGSSRFLLEATIGLPTGGSVTSGTFSGEGEFDFENQRGRYTLDFTDLFGSLGFPGNATADVLYDKTVLYMKFPLLTALLPGVEEWLKIDLATSGELVGVDLEQVTQQNDPSQFLNYLQAVSDDIEPVGQEQVRGVDTTHYRASIDLQTALEQAPEFQRDTIQALLDTGTTQLPVDSWIDDEGLVRKVDVDFPATADAGAGSVTMELFDFGVDVSVEPPPADQVTDISELQDSADATTAA